MGKFAQVRILTEEGRDTVLISYMPSDAAVDRSGEAFSGRFGLFVWDGKAQKMALLKKSQGFFLGEGARGEDGKLTEFAIGALRSLEKRLVNIYLKMEDQGLRRTFLEQDGSFVAVTEEDVGF